MAGRVAADKTHIGAQKATSEVKDEVCDHLVLLVELLDLEQEATRGDSVSQLSEARIQSRVL